MHHTHLGDPNTVEAAFPWAIVVVGEYFDDRRIPVIYAELLKKGGLSGKEVRELLG